MTCFCCREFQSAMCFQYQTPLTYVSPDIIHSALNWETNCWHLVSWRNKSCLLHLNTRRIQLSTQSKCIILPTSCRRYYHLFGSGMKMDRVLLISPKEMADSKALTNDGFSGFSWDSYRLPLGQTQRTLFPASQHSVPAMLLWLVDE